jgi:hypothetical protein
MTLFPLWFETAQISYVSLPGTHPSLKMKQEQEHHKNMMADPVAAFLIEGSM